MEEQEENPIIDVSFDIADVYLTYKSICVHLDRWCGGDPEEQERLLMLKDFFYRIVLEYKFRSM